VNTMKKWLYIGIGGIGALAITGGLLFAYTRSAAAALTLVPSQQDVTPVPSDPNLKGDGDHIGPLGDFEAALADALGITVDQLQAAETEAKTAAVKQAVTDGKLTQEQADAILSGDHPGGHGFRLGPEGDQYLADALGISVEKLQAAEKDAKSAVLAQAVQDGTITQDQADLMLAREALRPYLAQAMSDAYKAAVEKAVADGAITQAQADLLLANQQNGPTGDFGGFGGHGGHHGGPGWFGGPPPGDTPPGGNPNSAPSTAPTDTPSLNG